MNYETAINQMVDVCKAHAQGNTSVLTLRRALEDILSEHLHLPTVHRTTPTADEIKSLPRRMSKGNAVFALIHAEQSAAKRTPPRYTAAELKRFGTAFEALALSVAEENNIRRLMELKTR